MNGNVNVNVNLNLNGNDDELVDVNVNDTEGDRTEEENENQSQSVSEKGKKNGNKNDVNGSKIDEDEEKRMIEETPTHPSFTLRAQSVPQLNQHQQPSLSPRAESQPRTFSIGPPIDNNTNGRKRKREESKADRLEFHHHQSLPQFDLLPTHQHKQSRGSWKASTTQIEPQIVSTQSTKKRK